MDILQRVDRIRTLVSTYDKSMMEYISFIPEVDKSIVANNILHGKWNCLHFSASERTSSIIGLRIVPWENSLNWYVCKTLPYYETINLFPNFRDYIELQPILNSSASKAYFLNYQKKIDIAYKARLPLFELFEGSSDLQNLRTFLLNEDNCPPETADDEWIENAQMKVSNQYYKSELNNFFTEYVSEMKQDTFLPQIPSIDLGYLEERVRSSIATKAGVNAFDHDFIEVEPLLMQAVLYAHGFGTERFDISFEAAASETENHVFDPIESLLADYMRDDNSPEIKSLPEYKIALSMNEMQKSYNGVAHVEVAALMDDQYNDPKKAWKYLEAAGYWAGKNLPESQSVILNAAIHLCQKHGWDEASQVLEYNKSLMK